MNFIVFTYYYMLMLVFTYYGPPRKGCARQCLEHPFREVYNR